MNYLPNNGKKTKNVSGFDFPKPFHIKNLKITPLFVDHSLPGALMYFIEGSKNVLYSGDFRLSEIPQEQLTQIYDFLGRQKIDCFLCEGTRITEQTVLRERDVFERAKQRH